MQSDNILHPLTYASLLFVRKKIVRFWGYRRSKWTLDIFLVVQCHVEWTNLS